jgi:hypothetical protein
MHEVNLALRLEVRLAMNVHLLHADLRASRDLADSEDEPPARERGTVRTVRGGDDDVRSDERGTAHGGGRVLRCGQ